MNDDSAYEAVGRGCKRVLRLHPDDAGHLGLAEDDMLEVLGASGVPLRCWTRLDPTATAGAIQLDRFALDIIGTGSGGRARVRGLLRCTLS